MPSNKNTKPAQPKRTMIAACVLGGIVVFGVGAFKGDSEQAACAANLKAVQVATSAYTAKVGKAPESIDYLLKYEYLESAPAGIVIVDGKAVAKCKTS